MRRLALALSGLVLVGGCGTAQLMPAAEAPPVNGDPITPVSSVVPSTPRSIAIPKLGVVDDMVPVTVQSDGAMEVPPVEKTGWWSDAVRPGEPGVAVVLSHVNYKGVQGAFARLSELRKGDTVTVTDTAGVVRTFTVTETRTFEKDAFAENHDLLFDNPDNTRDVVLVTCGGTLVGHNYDSNVVARATEVT